MANEATNREELYNDEGEFILHFFPLDEKHVALWDDLLEDDEKGRLLDAIWNHELKKTGSYDDSKESKAFRACLGQFRRDCLPGARISAEKNYMKRSKGGKNGHKGKASDNNEEDDEEEEKDGDKKDLSIFKPPSKAAFRKLTIAVVGDLITQGRRKDKISDPEIYKEFDYFKATKWKTSGTRPIQSEKELKSILLCLYDFELLKLLDKAGAPNPVVLGAELLSFNKLQKRGVFCWGGVRDFAECYNTLSCKWIINGEDYNEWRNAFNAFIAERLRMLKNA